MLTDIGPLGRPSPQIAPPGIFEPCAVLRLVAIFRRGEAVRMRDRLRVDPVQGDERSDMIVRVGRRRLSRQLRTWC